MGSVVWDVGSDINSQAVAEISRAQTQAAA